MNRPDHTFPWLCLFTFFLGGCYSSSLIDPSGDEKEKVYTGNIKFVLSKDGTKYEFAFSPAIVRDSVVGVANGRKVSIALSDVSKVYTSEFSAAKTGGAVLGMLALVALVMGFVAFGWFLSWVPGH